MPELPEVEIVKRGLAPAMEGAAIAGVTLNRADLRFPFDRDFASRLHGQRIHRLSRRAKYIVAETESGLGLAMHLGMTGRFTILNQPGNGAAPHTPGEFYYSYEADPRHDHVVFAMSHGGTIRYNDVRRFGYMTLFELASMGKHPLFQTLGVEPLSEDLTPAYIALRAKGKTQPLKTFLLDQRIVAGLGNIYVCEALFRAGLPPGAESGSLSIGKKGAAAAERLCASIEGVLEDALRAGGSSLRDYRHADGGSGSFQESFDVYGREGETCNRDCGSVIERKVQQGRSTFYCPKCQRKI